MLSLNSPIEGGSGPSKPHSVTEKLAERYRMQIMLELKRDWKFKAKGFTFHSTYLASLDLPRKPGDFP